MNKTARRYLLLFLISGSIIALDQITKAIIRITLQPGEIWVPWDWIAPYARIVHWYNTGASFGMFQGKGPIFAAMAVLISVLIVAYYPKFAEQGWAMRIALGMQLGGALGNLIDRLFFGQVTDFISVGTFPVFNVADSSITVGVFILLLGVVIQEYREKKAVRSQANDAALPGEGIARDESES